MAENEKICNGCSHEYEQEESFAMSLLKDYKKQCKNWFIALMVVLGLWFTTIGGFLWYLYQYDYSSYSVEQITSDGGDANYIGENGDIYNGISESNNP